NAEIEALTVTVPGWDGTAHALFAGGDVTFDSGVASLTLGDVEVLEHAHQRRGNRGELQATVAELMPLSLSGKPLHGNLCGRPSKPLHEHLDDLVGSWRELSDTAAERAAAPGIPPGGRAATVASRSGITPIAAGRLDTDTA